MTEHVIPFVYEYLVEVSKLSMMDRHPEIKCHLEQLVKEECIKLEATFLLDLLEKMSKSNNVVEEARNLMEKHIHEIQSGSLIPEQDLLKRLDTIGQDGKKELDSTNR